MFAYDARSAKQLLTDRGLTVTTKPSYTCATPGRAVRTNPTAGARFAPGDSVRLLITQFSPNARCPLPQDTLAWKVLDFANHRGPAPAFAPEVTVYVDESVTSLTGAQAADPDSWGPRSALGLLAASSRQELRSGGHTLTPHLTVHTDDGTQFVCGGRTLPSALSGRESLWLDMEIPLPGAIGFCTFGNIYQTNGKIDAIVVRTSRPPHDGAGSGNETDPDPDGIGARFLAYARGETDELPVDTPVRLYLGNEYQKTINAADVADRTSWNLCAVYAERVCPPPMSAVTVLSEFAGEPTVQDTQPGGCVNWGRLAKPPTDTGGSQFVVLGGDDDSSCSQNFAVQIWSNDVEQITAVNLLLGSP